MHKKKAELTMIAKQSRQQSLQTITEQYLDIDHHDVDAFL